MFLYAEKNSFRNGDYFSCGNIVLCQKAGVRLKETFRESEETNSGAVIGMKEKENEKSDKKERGEKQGEAHKKRTVVVDAGHGGPDGEKRESTGSLRKS